MWVVRNDHACKSHGISWPGLPALSLALLTNRAIGHARLMHKEQSTPEAKSQGPRTKSQGTRGKDQEPRNKPLPCMDPHVQPSIIYIYIYLYLYSCFVTGSQFSKFPTSLYSSRFPCRSPEFQLSRFPDFVGQTLRSQPDPFPQPNACKDQILRKEPLLQRQVYLH